MITHIALATALGIAYLAWECFRSHSDDKGAWAETNLYLPKSSLAAETARSIELGSTIEWPYAYVSPCGYRECDCDKCRQQYGSPSCYIFDKRTACIVSQYTKHNCDLAKKRVAEMNAIYWESQS